MVINIDIEKLEELCIFESYKGRKKPIMGKPKIQSRIRKEGRVKKHEQGAARRVSA